MKLFELQDEPIKDQLIEILRKVSYPNSQREENLSKLYFLLKKNKFNFKLTDKQYRMGRIMTVHQKDFEKIADGDFTVNFYSNMVLPHFIIEGDYMDHIEKLVRAGVGGIIQNYDDPSGTEIASSFYAVAYEVPVNMIDIQLSIADTLKNLGVEKKESQLYSKAVREGEILAINKEAMKHPLDTKNVLAYCASRHGFVNVSKNPLKF